MADCLLLATTYGYEVDEVRNCYHYGFAARTTLLLLLLLLSHDCYCYWTARLGAELDEDLVLFVT